MRKRRQGRERLGSGAGAAWSRGAEVGFGQPGQYFEAKLYGGPTSCMRGVHRLFPPVTPPTRNAR